jgi:hypothetical protein
MCLDRLRLFALSFALCLGLQMTAEAVSLRPGKSTDDSVCDLAPNTTGFLGGTVLIPAAAAPKDQSDAYFRLGAQFVALRCTNGQLLIVQAMSDMPAAISSLTQLANSSCTAASVARTEVLVPFMGGSEPGFELRCVISKREELAAKLVDLERADPMESLKARLAAAARDPSSSTRATGSTADQKRDCGQVTLASLLQGGGCKK